MKNLTLLLILTVLSGSLVSGTSSVVWTFDCEGPVRSGAALHGDLLFIGSDSANVFALFKKDGLPKWKFKADSAVCSEIAVAEKTLFFSTKKGTLYALETADGKENFSFESVVGSNTLYPGGWDYFVSAPVISGKLVLFGSPDSYIYALNKEKGSLVWKFKTGDMVRCPPAVAGNMVYVGGMDGYMYALSLDKGKLKWKFKADGNKYFPKGEFLFKPVIYENKLFAGSRDATMYALNLTDGKPVWKVTDKSGFWYTNALIADGTLYAAGSDGHYIQALDPVTGKEKWKFFADDLIFSKPVFHESMLYFGSHDGFVYALNALTGKCVTRFQTGGDVLGGPVPDNITGTLFIGSDDGKVYALKFPSKPQHTRTVFRMIYHAPEFDGKAQHIQTDLPGKLADFFRNDGYETLDQNQLETFLTARIADKKASVIVLASFVYPYSVLKADEKEAALIRRYLDNGGTFCWIGNLPQLIMTIKEDKIAYAAETAKSLDLDKETFSRAAFYYDLYFTQPTAAGKKYGMPSWWSSGFGINVNAVTTPLALDEHGCATSWLKNYGGPEGTGLIRVWSGKRLPGDMKFLLNFESAPK